MPTLIVFCHLRWDFVFQRPQHLMTRLAETLQHPVRRGTGVTAKGRHT
jgi:hypothetical protein